MMVVITIELLAGANRVASSISAPPLSRKMTAEPRRSVIINSVSRNRERPNRHGNRESLKGFLDGVLAPGIFFSVVF